MSLRFPDDWGKLRRYLCPHCGTAHLRGLAGPPAPCGQCGTELDPDLCTVEDVAVMTRSWARAEIDRLDREGD